jgi:hypothetical protein
MPSRPSRWDDIPSPLGERMLTPSSVRVAVWLWIVSGLIAAATIGYAMLRLDELRTALRADVLARDPNLSAGSLDRAVLVLTVGSILLIAVPALLEIVLSLVMSRGRNWARILLAIVGVLSLPAVIIGGGTLAGPGPILTNYIQLGAIAMLGFTVVALVTMFLPSANAWFRSLK